MIIIAIYSEITMLIENHTEYQIEIKLGTFQSEYYVDDNNIVTIQGEDNELYQHQDGFHLALNAENQTLIQYILTLNSTEENTLDLCTKLFFYELGLLASSDLKYITSADEVDFKEAMLTSQLQHDIHNIDIFKVLSAFDSAPILKLTF